MDSLQFQQKLIGIQDRLMNFALKLTANREDALDLLQDTTLKVLNSQEKFITIADPLYPMTLKETYCPPLVLFYRGNLSLLHQPSIGVVGTRQITNYGQSALRGLLPPVIKRQIVVISGLAPVHG